MRAVAETHDVIDLPTVGNLVGFALYPVGWNWGEIPLSSKSPAPEYFEKAKEARFLEEEWEPPYAAVSSVASNTVLVGEKSRRGAVAKVILRLIRRSKIDAYITGEDERVRKASEETRRHDDLNLDFMRNMIGFHRLGAADHRWAFSADAPQVMDALNGELAWKNKSPQEWFFIERIARRRIEVAGVPEINDKFLAELLDDLTEARSNLGEPGTSRTKKLISSLRREYTESDKKIAPF